MTTPAASIKDAARYGGLTMFKTLAIVAATVVGAATAWAEDAPRRPWAQLNDGPVMILGAGALGLRGQTGDNRAAIVDAEWRGSALLGPLKPVLGLAVTSKGGGDVWAGIAADIPILDGWYLVPGVAPSGYAHGGGLALGSAFELRDSLALEYRLDNDCRFGLEGAYLSNLGLGNRDPGTETAMLTLTLPLGWHSSAARIANR